VGQKKTDTPVLKDVRYIITICDLMKHYNTRHLLKIVVRIGGLED
jgi:hypothetical protein